MLFIKKLILISALGGGITIPTVKAITYTEPDDRLLEYDAITKKWERLLKKIPHQELSKKLSTLFSANLTTFAKSAIENTVKQLLVNWIIEIWKNPNQYFPISHKLNKFFSEYQLSYWKIKNDLDDLSWELIKSFFTDFFFKEKGWLFLSQYGDFRTFALQDWIKQEKPMLIYEWNIDYSASSTDSKTYTEEFMKTKTSNDPYLWPEFFYNEQYSTFISRFKNANKVDLSPFSKKIYTLSDLRQLEDGYKLGTLLHLLTYVRANWSTVSPENIKTLELHKASHDAENKKDSYMDNPLYLFLEREDQANETTENIYKLAQPTDCSLIRNSIFKTEFSKKISNYDWKKPTYHFFSSNTHSCLYGLRELKNSLRLNEKLFASRETKGVSLYYLPHNKFEYSIDEITPEISQKLEKYLKDNFENVFFKYLNSKHSSVAQEHQGGSGAFNLKLLNTADSSNIGKWDFSTHYSQYSDLLTAAVEYRDSLYWMENIYELQRILSKIYSKLPLKILLKELKGATETQNSEVSSANSTWKIQLDPSEGLFSPLPFKRTTDEKSEEEEIEFTKLRQTSNTQNNVQFRRRRSTENSERKNDGFFSHLFDSLNPKKNFYSLESAAHKLREKIKEKITTTEIKNLFLRDLFLRSQFEKIAEDKLKSEFSIFKIWVEKILFNGNQSEQNEEGESITSMLSKYTSSLLKNGKDQNGNGWNDLIGKTIFLEKYLNLPIEEKSVFGSYQHSFKNEEKEQNKNITIEEDTNNSKITTKAKNSWILKNYYLSDSAYESTSEEYREFLSYLYSVYWMTKNNYENLPRVVNQVFRKDKNKNAYLVWFKNVDESELSSLKDQKEESSNGASTTENLSKLFETKISNDILNPLLVGKTTIEIQGTSANHKNQETNPGKENTPQLLKFNSENSLFKTQGYIKKQQEDINEQGNEKVELSGFAGIFTPTFSTREIPQKVKDAIFNSFWLKNSSSNTNFSDPKTDEKKNNETIGGIFFEDNHGEPLNSNEELKKFLLSFKTKQKLHKYLEVDNATRPYPQLLKALTSQQSQLDKEIDELTIQELKSKIEQTLENEIKTAESSPQGASTEFTNLYKMWNRFSGYLYHGTDRQYPYVLDIEEGGRTKHYLAFLYQVNKFDFEKEKIEKLKENISENTLHSMISLLASNKEVSEWIYKFGLAGKLSLS